LLDSARGAVKNAWAGYAAGDLIRPPRWVRGGAS
jgi:hypothetical protein